MNYQKLMASLLVLLCHIMPAFAQECADETSRISVDDAKMIIQKHMKLDPGAVFSVKDLTTDTIWKRLKVQVFQMNPMNFPNRSTVVIKNGRPTVIGQDFGGSGVTSLCVADLKRDGQPYLVYSYEWGSGIHRSQVGALNVLANDPTELTAVQALFNDPKHDWNVRAVDDKTVQVERGEVIFGKLVLTEDDNKTVLRISLSPDLKDSIRKNIHDQAK